MDGNFTILAPGADDAEFVDWRGLKSRFAIGRSAGYIHIKNDDFRSVVLRRKGCIKGRRLFDVASVRAYFARQSDKVDSRLSAVCQKANRVMREKKAEREASEREKEMTGEGK
jgi:hypothetical protein